jgi:hypothetical protein
VEWVIENLDPDPAFARFISAPMDIYKTLMSAIEKRRYQIHSGYSDSTHRTTGLTERYWLKALETDSVSPVFANWICDLFTDLKREHLLEPNIEKFLQLGENIRTARQYWRAPALYYAEHRKTLHAAAMSFYDAVQFHGHDFPTPFPLLVRPGWIRNAPLELKESIEERFLSVPGPIRVHDAPRLDGLSGPYITYRGRLGFAKRRVIRAEPQHNGEIFCARTVLLDEGGFVGFDYDLGLYFDYINTGEILGAELARYVLDNEETFEPWPERFRLRGAAEDAFDLLNRAAYPGVNCLSIFLNYTEPGKLSLGDWFLLHKRDETQLQAQNTVHVVPAGGHQGFAKGAQREDTSLWRTAVREFAEELFDKEGLDRQFETWSEFAEHPEIKQIKHSFFDEPDPAAKLYLHGFGLDPITLKPEVIFTLIVDWSKVRTRSHNLKFNWEMQTPDPKITRHQWVRLSKENLLREATQPRQSFGDRALDALPAGAACMLLTMKHYAELGLRNNDTQ